MQLREEIHSDHGAQTVGDQDDRARLGKLIQNGTLGGPATVPLTLVPTGRVHEPDPYLSEPAVVCDVVWQPGDHGAGAEPLPGPSHLGEFLLPPQVSQSRPLVVWFIPLRPGACRLRAGLSEEKFFQVGG